MRNRNKNRKKNKNYNDLQEILKELKYCNKSHHHTRAKELIEQLLDKYMYEPSVKFEVAMYYSKSNDKKNILKALSLYEELIDEKAPNQNTAMYEYIKLSIYFNYINDNVLNYINYLLNNNIKVMFVKYYYGKYLEKIGLIEAAKTNYKSSYELGYKKAEMAFLKLELRENKKIKNSDSVKNILDKKANTLYEIKIQNKILSEEGNLSKVKSNLQKYEKTILNYHTNSANVFFLFSQYLFIGDYESAKKIFDNNIDNINEDEAEYCKAQLALYTRNYEEAINYLNDLIKKNKNYVIKSYLDLAKIAEFFKEYDKQKNYYYKIIDSNMDKNGLAYFKMININIRENNIEEAKENLKKLSYELIKNNYIKVAQIKALLGLSFKDENIYSIKQIINYNLNDTICHIKKHTYKNINNKLNGYFNPDINIEDLTKEMMLKINHLEPDYTDVFFHYIIHYPSVGFYNSNEVEYINIVAIPHTNKIITMFPIASNNLFALNYIEPKKELHNKSKVKRKSQIDKFYARYGKND